MIFLVKIDNKITITPDNKVAEGLFCEISDFLFTVNPFQRIGKSCTSQEIHDFLYKTHINTPINLPQKFPLWGCL